MDYDDSEYISKVKRALYCRWINWDPVATKNKNRLLLNLSISRGLHYCLKAIRSLFNDVSWYLNLIYRFQILQVLLWDILVGFSR